MSSLVPRSSHYSPLRYPGGKGKVAAFVKEILTLNHLEDCHYVEPYAGGAAVALELLFHGYAKTIHINDLAPGVAAFWRCVLQKPDELNRLIHDARMSIKEWQKQRAIALLPGAPSDLELGFATFYLNRTNRSGILRAGVIGGLAQDGAWKLDARFNKPALIQRITSIAKLADKIQFTQLDASDLLAEIEPLEKTFLYLDPPYYGKGKDLYTHFYEPKDHELIAKKVSQLKDIRWIVSYDDVHNISDLYEKYRCIRYTLSYSAQNRYRGSEVMFFSPKLKIPPFTGSMQELPQARAA